jgi:hypothetical protein
VVIHGGESQYKHARVGRNGQGSDGSGRVRSYQEEEVN